MTLLNSDFEFQNQEELLRFAFVDGLIDEQQIYPPSETFEQIHKRINEMFLEASLFKNAYSDLEILEGSLEGDVFKLDYRLGKTYTAYSYFQKSKAPPSNVTCACLIIPGSGKNQSSTIFRKDLSNYHGNVLEITEKYGDTFIFIKPNEDILAIHDGKNKLDYAFITPYLLNYGSSYSAHYIANSIAFIKYLQSQYDEVFILGLSQGGAAALLNALQSEPTAAVVASGFSVMTKTISWSGFHQIIIPGLYVDVSFDNLYSMLKDSSTQYLFTYGKQEKGTYKIEADKGYSCRFLQGLDNVKCVIHDEGHMFPQDLVEDFLSSNR